MVPGGGFEPPTRGFSVHCSTPELPGRGRGGSKTPPWVRLFAPFRRLSADLQQLPCVFMAIRRVLFGFYRGFICAGGLVQFFCILRTLKIPQILIRIKPASHAITLAQPLAQINIRTPFGTKRTHFGVRLFPTNRASHRIAFIFARFRAGFGVVILSRFFIVWVTQKFKHKQT